MVDGDSDNQQQQTQNNLADIGLAKHLPRLGKVVGTDEMGHLNGEADGRRTQHAADEPRCRLNQPDAGRGLGTQMPHHAGINEEHHHGG